MTVAAPTRPASKAGLDGVAAVVVERRQIDVAARLAADDALGVPRSAPSDAAPTVASRPGGMEVAAAAPAEVGLFDGIVGSLLGFLFG